MAHAEEDPLTPLIDTYFLTRDNSEERLRSYTINMEERPRPPGRLSPSSICACERQAAFKFVGMPGRTQVDPESQAIFDDGHWRHHKWQATFLDMELVLGPKKFKVISIEEDVEVPELYIAGAADAVIVINGKKWVVDFKGINSWGFEAVFRNHKPHEKHVLQLLAYMKARKIRRGLILYDHKDRSRTKIFAIHFTGKDWAEVEEWCERVLRKLDRQELPPMSLDCHSGTMLFEKCPWAHVCYGKASPAKIKKRMYRNFTSVDEMWEYGKQMIEEHAEKSHTPDDI